MVGDMEVSPVNYESKNINEKWLMNIYENLKNLEEMERMARNGFSNLMEYLQIDYSGRDIVIPDLQYQNLRLMVGELWLLSTDLVPVISKTFYSDITSALGKYDEMVSDRKALVIDVMNQRDKKISHSILTELFYKILHAVSQMRVKIINEIAGILYVKDEMKIEKIRAMGEI